METSPGIEINKNWDKIVEQSKAESEFYFKNFNQNSKHIDMPVLRKIISIYCLNKQLPTINEGDIQYAMDFYSHGSGLLTLNQFEELIESLKVIQFLNLDIAN